MRTSFATLLGTSVLCLLLGTSVGAASPATAATPKDCQGRYVCLYEDNNFRGTMVKIDCDNGETRLGSFAYRASSIIHKCNKTAVLYGADIRQKTEGFPLAISNRVTSGTWANLGGDRKVDNRVFSVFITPF